MTTTTKTPPSDLDHATPTPIPTPVNDNTAVLNAGEPDDGLHPEDRARIDALMQTPTIGAETLRQYRHKIGGYLDWCAGQGYRHSS